jgi:hypothetical protein
MKLYKYKNRKLRVKPKIKGDHFALGGFRDVAGYVNQKWFQNPSLNSKERGLTSVYKYYTQRRNKSRIRPLNR